MTRTTSRTKNCSRKDAHVRLMQAESFVKTAQMVAEETKNEFNPGVSASLAVLAGIAASDAACCARLGVRSRGEAHSDAVALLGTVIPHGAIMAKDLQRLLNRKDDSHYGVTFVSSLDALRMISWARRIVASARVAVEA